MDFLSPNKYDKNCEISVVPTNVEHMCVQQRFWLMYTVYDIDMK